MYYYYYYFMMQDSLDDSFNHTCNHTYNNSNTILISNPILSIIISIIGIFITSYMIYKIMEFLVVPTNKLEEKKKRRRDRIKKIFKI